MMRDYFLQHLGIGEVWKLRASLPDAPVLAADEVVRPAASTSTAQSCDLVLIYRHPEEGDDMFQQDSVRLSTQVLAALSFNQSLNIQSLALTGESMAQMISTVQSWCPRAVLVLGRADACGLLSRDSATVPANLRQGNHCLEDIPVIVTHELATLLQQPALKHELWLDMCRVKDMFVH